MSGVKTSAGHGFSWSLPVHRIPALDINIKARLHIQPQRPQAHQNSSPIHGPGGGQSSQHVSQSGCPFLKKKKEKNLSHVSTPRLFSPLFLNAGGGEEKNHLLTDSAILDFCYSPSVTWSAPAFTRGGVRLMKMWSSTSRQRGMCVCLCVSLYVCVAGWINACDYGRGKELFLGRVLYCNIRACGSPSVTYTHYHVFITLCSFMSQL